MKEPIQEPGFDAEVETKKFVEQRPLYEAFTDCLANAVSEVLASQKVQIHLIERRTKTVEGFAEKITRDSKNYSNPLLQLTDLSGIRVIAFDKKSIDQIDYLVHRFFSVDPKNSVDKATELNDDQFGYQSKHYIIELNNLRLQLPENERFRGLRAELQIRTVFQHAWAVINHKLNYKRSSDAPREILRRLYLLSGLCEVADKEFNEILSAAQDYEQKTAKLDLNASSAVELSSITLEQYINTSEVARDLYGGLEAHGILCDFGPIDKVEALSQAVVILRRLGLLTVRDLQEALKAGKESFEANIKKIRRDVIPVDTWSPSIVIEIAAMFARLEMITEDMLVAGGYHSSVSERLLRFLNELSK